MATVGNLAWDQAIGEVGRRTTRETFGRIFELTVAKTKWTNPFAEPGNSGALITTTDGYAVGVVYIWWVEERANPVNVGEEGGVWSEKKSSPRDEKGDLDGDSRGISGDYIEFEDDS